MAVRTSGDPAIVAARVRETLRTIAPLVPVLRMQTLERQLDDVLAQDRMIASLATMFGAIAALLACVGLYGTPAYTTAARTNEIGVRLALGATRAGVLIMIQ